MRVTNFTVLSLIMASMLGGCGRDHQPRGPVPEAAESAAPSSQPEVAGGSGDPPAAALTIRVLREDRDDGVAATIGRLDDTNIEHYVVDVDDSGIARLTQPCTAGERFAAKPKVATYLRTAPQACAQTITFRLYGAQATYRLIQIADEATTAGDLVVAQANYGLAAERLRYAQPEESAHLTVLANATAGRILGVQAPTISQDGRDSVSHEMVDRLKTYQRATGLRESGVLDVATREAISKMPANQVLDRAIDTTAATNTVTQQQSVLKAAEVRTVVLSPAAQTEATNIRKHIDRSAVRQ
jgi:hypothetical protein